MILVDVKQDTSKIPTLNNLPKDEEKTLSFSDLLKGINLKNDTKIIQNGATTLNIELSDEKAIKKEKITSKETLLALLKNEKELPHKESEHSELNQKVLAILTPSEVKTLVNDAKKYLKNKILQSDGYKKAEIKELPKTLQGLVNLAKKFDIKIEKITLESVKTSTPRLKPLNNTLEKPIDINQQKTSKPFEKMLKEPQNKVKTTQSQIVVTQTSETKVTQEVKTTQPQKIELQTSQAKVTPEVKTTQPQKIETANFSKEESKIVRNIETKIDSTPLFKAQSTSEHTTQQVVQIKQFKVEEKTPKTKADETLKLLLRTEKSLQINSGLTADFSVATAKVIAPTAVSEISSSLESLLHGDTKESTSASKIDGIATHKADSFEVKINEAKQMIKYLSSDVKTAIEDYKSPFTRIKVQLNPQKLGEVDLTIVQRGKNLHVNISSNNTAITTLASNVAELRVQLSSNGINNATLNFNNSSQNENSNSGQQQQRQNEQKRANEEYNYFDSEETNEEVLSSLEIVVPSYA